MNSQDVLNKQEALEKLTPIGQAHLLHYFDGLDAFKKNQLLSQISHLSLDTFELQKEALQKQTNLRDSEPFYDFFSSKNQSDFSRGRESASMGKTACLVLAGGQGSRLRFNGPKGCFPISNVKKKSLYQLICEKVKAAGQMLHTKLEIAFMTSPLNHLETENFFIQNAFFGLDPQQVHFFYQKMWPFLDFEKNLFLEEPHKIAMGPNGNGGVFLRLVDSGIFKKWEEKGIERVSIISVDNPLALPFDFELFGFHESHDCDVAIKAAHRLNPAEKVGVIVQQKGKPTVIEYTELQENFENAPKIANLGLYCFSMSFIHKAAKKIMPLHAAKKSVKKFFDDQVCLPEEPNAWKFEKFIFDAFSLSDHTSALLYPREECFAPLKNFEKEDSIDSVQAALMALERKIYERISGKSVLEDAIFELAPEFYYPTEAFLETWKGRAFPNTGYIEGS